MVEILANMDGLEFEKEAKASPLEKSYFTGDMLQKYEPCTDALKRLVDSGGDDEDTWNEFEVLFDNFIGFNWYESNWDGTRYDIVFYGSGYTSYLLMEYLKRTALKRNPEKFTFAFAGRTVSKVVEMRDRVFGGTEWEDTPVIQADFDNVTSMIDLAKSAYCIVNIAGPYMLVQGELLIDACCATGTNYMDVSGEIPWTLRTLDLDEHAKKGGACIIPSSAFAGAYPDIMLYMAAKKLREEHGEEVRRAICYKRGGGAMAGASGGTLATRAAMSTAEDDVRKAMADPFALGGFIPDIDRNGVKECTIKAGTGKVTLKTRREDGDAILSKVSQCPYTGVWRHPDVYATFDSRIVRETNKLLADLEDQPYGRNLNFQQFGMMPPEALLEKKEPEKKGVSVADEEAALKAQGLYYAKGEGPPLESLGDAWTAVYMWAQGEKGTEVKCCSLGMDGYFETARCAVEMAMTCRFDKAELPHKGGVMTAASCGQGWFAKRLIQSGIKFRMGGWWEESELKSPGYNP